MQKMTFRSSKIVYYGPHPCSNCGDMICKMGNEFGGNAFAYPNGPIYPNTEWHPHVCDPKNVLQKQGEYAKQRVMKDRPLARVKPTGSREHFTCQVWDGDSLLSNNGTHYGSEWHAWMDAKARLFPTEGEVYPKGL